MVRRTSIGLIAVCVLTITVGCAEKFGENLAKLTYASNLALLPTGDQYSTATDTNDFWIGARVNTSAQVGVYALSLGGTCGSPYCGAKIGTQASGALGSIGSTTVALYGGQQYSSVMFDTGLNGYVLSTQLKPAVSTRFTVSPDARYPLVTDFVLVTKKAETYAYPGSVSAKETKNRGAAGRVIGGPMLKPIINETMNRTWWKIDFFHGRDGWVTDDTITPLESLKITKNSRVQTLKAGSVYSVKMSATPPLYNASAIGTQTAGRRGTASTSVLVSLSGTTAIYRYVNFDKGTDGYYPESSLGQPTANSVNSLSLKKIKLPLPAAGSSAMTTLLSSVNSELALNAQMTEAGLRSMVSSLGLGSADNSEMVVMRVNADGEVKADGSIVLGYVETSAGKPVVAAVDTQTNTSITLTMHTGTDGITQSATYNDGNKTTKVDVTVNIITDANGDNRLSLTSIDQDNQLETYTLTGPLTTTTGPDGSVTIEAAGQTTVNPDGTVYVNEGTVVISYTPGTAPTSPSDSPYTDPSGETHPTTDTAPSESVSTASEMKKYNVIGTARPRGLRFPPAAMIDTTPLSTVPYKGTAYINWRSVGATKCLGSWTNKALPPFGSMKTLPLDGTGAATANTQYNIYTYEYGVSCTDGKNWSATSTTWLQTLAN